MLQIEEWFRRPQRRTERKTAPAAKPVTAAVHRSQETADESQEDVALQDSVAEAEELEHISEQIGQEILRELAPWELCQIYLKLLYPEKFWKIVNHYYNARKTWVSQRDIDKLTRLSEQEIKREEFLSMLFYLVK